MMLGENISMKKIFKVLAFGIMLAVIAVGAAVPSFAQDGDQKVKEDLYAKYNKYYNSAKVEEKQMAVEAGKEYIQKFGEDAESDPLVPYFKENIPLLEKQIEDQKKKDEEANNRKKNVAEANRILQGLTQNIKSGNWEQVFVLGNDIQTKDQEFLKNYLANYLDVYIVLSTIGYDRAFEKNQPNAANVKTFNSETINYAKKALQAIKNGETSKTYGADFGENRVYQFNNKENALGWLNYEIGYVLAKNENKYEEALPYLYEATKYDAQPKKASDVYNLIGEYYFNKVAELEQERQAIRQSLNNSDNKKTVELFTMQKGYADRGMDYYAKAYSIENKNAKANAQYKEYLLNRFNKLYTFRHNGKPEGSEAYLASIDSKTLPNPTTQVQPIVEEMDRELLKSIEETNAAADGTMTKPADANGNKTTKPADTGSKTTPQPTKP